MLFNRLFRYGRFALSFLVPRGAAILTIILAAAVLVPHDFVRFGLAQSVIAFSCHIVTAGYVTAHARAVVVVPEADLADRILWAGVFIPPLLAAAVLALVITLMLLVGVTDPLTEGDPLIMVALGVSSCIFTLYSTLAIALRIRRFEGGFTMTSVVSGVLPVPLVAIAGWFGEHALLWTIVSVGLSYGTGVVLSFVWLRGIRPPREWAVRQLMVTGRGYALGTLAHQTNIWLSTLGLRWVAALTINVSALPAFSVVTYLLQNGMLLTGIAYEFVRLDYLRLSAEKQDDQARRKLNRAAGTSLMMTVGIVAVALAALWLLGGYLPPVYRPSYLDTALPLLIMIALGYYYRAIWQAAALDRMIQVGLPPLLIVAVTGPAIYAAGVQWGVVGLLCAAALQATGQAGIASWRVAAAKRTLARAA